MFPQIKEKCKITLAGLKQAPNHFTTKLTLLFLSALILPLLLISALFYKISSDTYGDKIIQATKQTSNQLIQQIEERFDQLSRVSFTVGDYMLNFPSYLYGLAYNNPPSISEQMDTFYALRNNVWSLISSFDLKHICIFLDSNSMFSNEGLTFYDLEELASFDISPEQLTASNSGQIWLYIPKQNYPFILVKTYDPSSVILCLSSQIADSDNVLNYAYFIAIDSSEFDEMLSTAYSNHEVCGYLIDSSGTVISSSESAESPYYRDSFTEDEMENLHSHAPFDAGSARYYSDRLSNGWMYITRISDRYINSNMSAYFRTMMIILAVIIPVAGIGAVLLCKSVTRRISQLSNAVRKVNFKKNQLQIKNIEYVKNKPRKSFDEIDILADTYNEMVDMIQENIGHITELSAQKETLKYQLLQSLINPHFLYNILDSIATCNRLGKTELANKMIFNLTRFYRMTLRKSDELITIRDELEITRLYMELESICRGGNFTWEFDLDEEIENFLICKFTLQPFVENSILHGMQGFNQTLHIKIDIRYGDDTICIFISDDGHGIAPGKLQELKESLASKQINTSKHFGICNVNARISSRRFGYGSVEIDSEPNEGTHVKLEFQQLLP